MKLVTRLTLAFLLVVLIAISFNEQRRLSDELDDFEADMDRTHLLVASTLADAVEVVAPREGLRAARQLVESSGRHRTGDLAVRWVCLEGAEVDVPAEPALFPCSELAQVEVSRTFTVPGRSSDRHVTVVPVRIGERDQGAIEVSESDDYEREWSRRHVQAAVWLGVMSVAGMTLFAFVLGWWLVARPTRALVAKARAVGRGELLPALALPTGDEFEQLATEMNAMCGHLADARRVTAEATAAREAAEQHLRHADRLATVGRLASGLAHELGTPLNVIEARAELIAQDTQADDAARQSARVIISCSEQVTKLVRQLLVFARPRKTEAAPVSLDALSRSVAELIGPLAAKKPVTIDVSGLSPARSLGDEVLLQQAVTNLVVNALHACGPDGHVWLRSGVVDEKAPGDEQARRFCTVSVKDDGVGIAPELRASIFEPFFSTRPVGEGTGLGLPIVTSIVDEHGGFITLDSEREAGSTFTIHLPEATT